MVGLEKSSLMSVVRSKCFFLCALAMLLCVFSLRVRNLDCDLPSWGVSLYTSLDEGTYASMALNKYNYGVVNCERLAVPSRTDFAHRNNVIGNAVTFCSLALVGDTYAGLRLPSLLWAFGTLLLMFVVLYRRLPDGPWRPWLILGALAVPIVNFQFLMASRVVEPSVVRMFFVMLLVALLSGPKRTAFKMFLSGFVAVASIVMVYMTNAFVGLPLVVLLVVDWVRGERWKPICLVSGMALADDLGEVYYHLVWNTSFFANAIATVASFAKVGGYAISAEPLGVVHNIKMFVFNRTFLYDAPLLALVVFLLPESVARFRRKGLSSDHLMLAFIASFLLQTLFVEDYVARKFVVIYPLVVLYVAFSLSHDLAFWKNLAGKYVHVAFGSGTSDVCAGRWMPYGRYGVLIGVVGSMLLALVSVHFQVYDYRPTKVDFKQGLDRQVAAFALMIPLALCALVCLWRNRRWIWATVVLMVMGWLVANGYFSIKYVYANRLHVERDFMQKIGRELKDGRLWGQRTYSYTLYNGLKPVEGDFEQLMASIKESGKGLFLDYEPRYADMRLFNAATRAGLSILPAITLRHSFWTFGGFRDNVFYEVKPFASKRIRLSKLEEWLLLQQGLEIPQDENAEASVPEELLRLAMIRIGQSASQATHMGN